MASNLKTGVVHNPNNWHWVDKNGLPWSKAYLETNLTGISHENTGYTVQVTSVSAVKGDCDVTQRKGRTRCIYDMVLELKVSYKETESEEEHLYDVTIPEFIHDQAEDEYDFDIKTGPLEYKKYIRSDLVPLIKAKLIKFQPDLIAEFDPQVKHNTD